MKDGFSGAEGPPCAGHGLSRGSFGSGVAAQGARVTVCGRHKPAVTGGVGGSGQAVAGWPVKGVENVEPGVLPAPMLRQMECEVAAAVPGDAGGNGDQVAA